MGVFTLVAALFLAYAFTPAVSQYIHDSEWIENVSDSIGDTIKSLSRNDEGTFNLEKMFQDMPDAFQQIIDRYNADERTLSQTAPVHPQAEESAVDTLSEMIAAPVVNVISDILAFLLIFIASVIVLKLLTWILDLIFQLPVLKTANTFLGLLVGVVIALVWAWVLSSSILQ